jgi:hypothetical protein
MVGLVQPTKTRPESGLFTHLLTSGFVAVDLHLTSAREDVKTLEMGLHSLAK